MKKQALKLIAVIFITVSAVQTGMSQPGWRNNEDMRGEKRCMMISDLTDEQKAKIEDLRNEHFKNMQALHFEMEENRLEHRKLMASNADKNALFANIDKMTSIKNKLMKERVSHRLAVRNLLTDEQKEEFDARSVRRGDRMGRGYRGGHRGGFGHEGMRGQGRGACMW